jgi:DNA polymerase epsilon subunit 3
MRDTEFDFMIPRLEAELAQWNSIQTGKRNEYRKKIRESTGGRKIEGGDDAADPNEQLSREILGAASADSRSAKRVKGADGEILEGEGEDDRDVEMDEQAEDEVEDDAEEEEEEDDEEEDEAEDENGDDPLEEVEEEGLEDSPTGAGREASEDESD